MVRVVLGIILLLLVAALAIWFFDRNTPHEIDVPADGPLTLTGTIVCLPKEGPGPQTLECAYGLYGTDGNYYQLRDASATSGPSRITTFPIGATVSVSGIFITEDDPSYATVGTITLENITDEGSFTSTEDTSADDVTHSDGTITFSVPTDFGFAVSPEQILVNSVIPPCTTPFLYCLYYTGGAYTNTTFESAGITIAKRADIEDETQCLTTPPFGYMLSPSATSSLPSYAMSVFSPLQDSATGHSTSGEEFRLYTSNTCYAFTTRVGSTQIDTYGSTTLTVFTDTDREQLLSELRSVIASISLTGYDIEIGIPAE